MHHAPPNQKPHLFFSPLVRLKFFLWYDFSATKMQQPDDSIEDLPQEENQDQFPENDTQKMPSNTVAKNITILLIVSVLQGTILSGATIGLNQAFHQWYFYAPCAAIVGCWFTVINGMQGRLYGAAVGMGVVTMVFFQEEILSALNCTLQNFSIVEQQFCLLGLCIGAAFLMNTLISLARYSDGLEIQKKMNTALNQQREGYNQIIDNYQQEIDAQHHTIENQNRRLQELEQQLNNRENSSSEQSNPQSQPEVKQSVLEKVIEGTKTMRNVSSTVRDIGTAASWLFWGAGIAASALM